MEDTPPCKGAVLGWGSPSFLHRGRVLRWVTAPSLQEVRVRGDPSSPEGRVLGGEGNTCASLRTSQGGEMGLGMGAGVEGVPVQL